MATPTTHTTENNIRKSTITTEGVTKPALSSRRGPKMKVTSSRRLRVVERVQSIAGFRC